MKDLTPLEAYDELCKISRKLTYISSSLSLSGWDERTYIPPLGYKHRAELHAILSEYIYEEWTKDYIGDLINKAKEGDLVYKTI